jgi:hypothetical protein
MPNIHKTQKQRVCNECNSGGSGAVSHQAPPSPAEGRRHGSSHNSRLVSPQTLVVRHWNMMPSSR